MADRYHVIVTDSNFDMEDWENQGKDVYDLYDMWRDPKQSLPPDVWFEEWYVENGKEWNTHPNFDHHDLVEEKCYLIDWEELGTPYMIKDEHWWSERIKVLESLHELLVAIYPPADRLLNEVIDILDPDQETLIEEMQGQEQWTDADTLGHWLDLAKHHAWSPREHMASLPEEDQKILRGEK